MGREFTCGTFQELLARLNLKDSQSTSKNPQLNALCKQIHQMVADILWTLLHNNPPKDLSQAKDVIDDALATAIHTMRPTVATTIGITRGALAFSRDMFLNVSLVAYWQMIAQLREYHINKHSRQ